MCHPKGDETKFRIAAKATPRKTVAKAGHTLKHKIAAGDFVKAVNKEQETYSTVEKAVNEQIAGEMALQWKNIAQVLTVRTVESNNFLLIC